MSPRERRYFWGNSLPQALMSAARYHQLPPEEVEYRVREKRHGFVRHPRRVVIEVNPSEPRKPENARTPPRVAPQLRQTAAASQGRRAAPRQDVRDRREPPSLATQSEPLLPPDEDSELAAQEGLRRLLDLAGLELEIAIARESERLQIRLSGRDESELQRRGSGFLDELEHLLPRTIKGLSGRLVRCRVDGAGLREGREEELRRLATETANDVLRSGEDAVLGPLSPADRRIIHLALAGDPRLRTESFGSRPDKKLRISRTEP